MFYHPNSYVVGARDVAAAWILCLSIAGAGAVVIPASALLVPMAADNLAEEKPARPIVQCEPMRGSDAPVTMAARH